MESDSVPSQLSNLIFVYGTLKRGYTNYTRYLAVAEDHGTARFLARGVTVDKFPLVIRSKHLPPVTCGPVMMDVPGVGAEIQGELWYVNASCLEGLDILEGVKTGAYHHREIQVIELQGDGDEPVNRHGCVAYFYPAKEELLALKPYLSNYGDAEHAQYIPRPEANSDIVNLMQQPMHRLQTSPVGHAMQVHVFRLLPGEDLLKALKAFVAERGMEAAVVLSCVGSTGKTTLRPAGVPTPKVFEGKFEICSLTGTLSSTGGHHIHMSISDHECRAFGGHLVEGSIVRTTAEITLGEIDGAGFSRPRDVRTGYDELSISTLGPGSSKRDRYETAQGDGGGWQSVGRRDSSAAQYKRAKGDTEMWLGKVAVARDQSEFELNH